MPAPDELWEQLRRVTLDQVVTAVKLRGSCIDIRGFTTPEGWPFRLVVAVGAPGNEGAVELLDEALRRIGERAAWSRGGENPRASPGGQQVWLCARCGEAPIPIDDVAAHLRDVHGQVPAPDAGEGEPHAG